MEGFFLVCVAYHETCNEFVFCESHTTSFQHESDNSEVSFMNVGWISTACRCITKINDASNPQGCVAPPVGNMRVANIV